MVLASIVGWALVLSVAVHLHMMYYADQQVTIGTTSSMREMRAAWDGGGGGRGNGASSSSPPCRATAPPPDLGFDYPPLRRARQLVLQLLCLGDAAPSVRATRAAYAAALGVAADAAGGGGAVEDADSAKEGAAALLQELLQASIEILTGPESTLLDCPLDATLLAALRAPGGDADATISSAPRRRYLLASNLRNAGALGPHFVREALRLALLLPPGALGVSVYESGSADTTRLWLTLLRLLLLPLRVPATITTQGALKPAGSAGAPLRKERVELLAELRNAALDPWLHGGDAANASSSPPSVAGFAPDVVVFANDVWLCAGHALRLAQYRAALACGMDFYTAPWEAALREARGGGGGGVDDDEAPRRRQRALAVAATAGGDDDDETLLFYDKWVSRDVSGAKFSNAPPYARGHARTAAALAAGWPVQAHCCWNGLAVLDAAPLRGGGDGGGASGAHHAPGVRFRSHAPGECAASECSLLCDDLAARAVAAGGVGSRVVIDPSVRLAYEPLQAAALLAGRGGVSPGAFFAAPEPQEQQPSRRGDGALPGLGPLRSWAEVAEHSAGLIGGGAAFGAVDYARIECCDLQRGAGVVDFDAHCRRARIAAADGVAAAAAAAR